MYESRIAADSPKVAVNDGFPPAIDALAAHNLAGHAFLRAAWYRAGAINQAGKTVLIRRGGHGDGEVIAAIPTTPFGPAMVGARKVPGPYWPFRAVLIAPNCNPLELAQGLERAASCGLGPAWRIGPARLDEAATHLLIRAVQQAGWTIFSRPAGTSWLIDLDAARAAGWPRPSTAKRLRRLERRLGNLGEVRWDHVRGSDWSDDVLRDLGAVEAASWIAAETDGSGAKFMTPEKRQVWHTALSDPKLAEMLCATILRVDGRAVAFSFDLDDGPVQYGIAGTYITELSRYDIGKLANYRALDDAIAEGQSLMDLGAGDSGYKRKMGAVAGYDMADLLFVRRRSAARLLARLWGPPVATGVLFDGPFAAQVHG